SVTPFLKTIWATIGVIGRNVVAYVTFARHPIAIGAEQTVAVGLPNASGRRYVTEIVVPSASLLSATLDCDRTFCSGSPAPWLTMARRAPSRAALVTEV